MYMMLLKYGAPAILVLGVVGALYFQHSRIESLNQELSSAKTTINTQKQTISSIRSTVERNQKALSEFDSKVKEIRNETSQLEQTLSEHNLEVLAREKPGLIENRANSATKEVLNDLEEASKY